MCSASFSALRDDSQSVYMLVMAFKCLGGLKHLFSRRTCGEVSQTFVQPQPIYSQGETYADMFSTSWTGYSYKAAADSASRARPPAGAPADPNPDQVLSSPAHNTSTGRHNQILCGGGRHRKCQIVSSSQLMLLLETCSAEVLLKNRDGMLLSVEHHLGHRPGPSIR